MKKFFKIILSVLLCVVILTGVSVLCFGGYVMYSKNCEIKLSLDESKQYQTITGFGASACWWSQVAGGSENLDTAVKSLYSEQGLGLNVYRYNIGGGSKDNPNCRFKDSMWRTTESFLYYNEETQKYEFDFNRDMNAQKALDAALSYGQIDTVVLFANSPHFSLTKNGLTESGETDGVSNLAEENYQAYADYFLDITEYFLSKNVPVKYISPINEPQWGWGGESVHQEGCHYEPEEAAALFSVFAREIEKRGLQVKLSGIESGNIGDTAKKYYELLSNDEVVMRNLGAYSYHSYFTDGESLKKAKFGKWLDESIADGIEKEMSEWCELPCKTPTDDITSAVITAGVIADDIGLSHVNSWSAWVGVNTIGISEEDGKNYSDGLLSASDDFSEISVSDRWYGVAHFTKFVPIGSKLIDCNKNVTDFNFSNFDLTNTATWKNSYIKACAFLTPDNETVLIIVNSGKERTVSIDKAAQTMAIYQTYADLKLDNTYNGEVKTQITVPENSITTIIYTK